jgi:transposase
MQGKEASEQETVKYSAGIDVGKSWLDAHIVPADISLRVANTREGIAKLKRWLMRIKPDLVAVEATGKWHRLVCRSLHASGIAVSVAVPYRVRMFAKAQGILAKTDKLDARVLAQFAAVMAPPAHAPAPQVLEELQELVTARDSAVAEETALKNQLAVAETVFLKKQLARRIVRIKADLKALEGECRKRIEADPGLARRYEILISIPGIGSKIAITLIAALSELGSLNSKQIASLAGLAPMANDSGQHQGARIIRGGRAIVRKMLYLAAVSAARCDAALRAFYLRLAEKKPVKVALVATARKLVLLANTLIAENRLWQPVAPVHA